MNGFAENIKGMGIHTSRIPADNRRIIAQQMMSTMPHESSLNPIEKLVCDFIRHAVTTKDEPLKCAETDLLKDWVSNLNDTQKVINRDFIKSVEEFTYDSNEPFQSISTMLDALSGQSWYEFDDVLLTIQENRKLKASLDVQAKRITELEAAIKKLQVKTPPNGNGNHHVKIATPSTPTLMPAVPKISPNETAVSYLSAYYQSIKEKKPYDADAMKKIFDCVIEAGRTIF